MAPRPFAWFALSTLAVAAGCDVFTSLGDGGSPGPDLAMGRSNANPILIPSDYTTYWQLSEQSGAQLGANIEDPKSTLNSVGFDIVAATVQLRTWPELSPVGATLGKTYNGGGTSIITLTPTSPLADRWYVVSMSPPAQWRFPGKPLSDGSAGARFRYGSEPRFITVTVCGTDTSPTFALAFSELVNTSVTDEKRVTIRHEGAGGPSCTGITDHAKPSGLTLDFSCNAVDPKLLLHFQIAPGVVSPASMLPVDNGDTIDRTITLQDLPSPGYCRTIRWY